MVEAQTYGPKPSRRRKAPASPRTPILQEDALLECLEEHDIKLVNAMKLWRWVLAHPLESEWSSVPWEALGLPKKMATVVPQYFVLHSSSVAERFDSKDGSTTKLLVNLHDGERVEAVIMRHGTRATLCVSSQVGCAMGCTFCATGTMGLRGNLSSGEILEQLLHAGAVETIRNIVFMGMGEPLHNYPAVLASLKAMTDTKRWSLRHGHITVSTVGVIGNMHKLTADMPGISLALSLHAPTQAIREIIVPTAKAHPLPQLLEALDRHLANCKKKSNSPSTVAGMIEYILIAGVNDSKECAHLLGEMLKDRNVMLNVIPYNDTTQVIVNKTFKAPTWEATDAFQSEVVKYGVITRVRREMGDDIAAACGQLALTNEADAAAGGPKTSATLPSPSPTLEACAANNQTAAGAGMLSGDMEDFGRPKGYPSQPQKHQYTDVAAAAAASTSNKEGGRVKPTGANVKKVIGTKPPRTNVLGGRTAKIQPQQARIVGSGPYTGPSPLVATAAAAPAVPDTAAPANAAAAPATTSASSVPSTAAAAAVASAEAQVAQLHAEATEAMATAAKSAVEAQKAADRAIVAAMVLGAVTTGVALWMQYKQAQKH